ncbi:MAG: hypothetical protein MR407_00160 [Roseburia sp.]|nr:hypothetical protein [Roseburia sp.]
MEKTKQKITKGFMIALFSIMTIAFSFLYVKMCQDKYTAGMFVRTFVTIFVSALVYYGLVKAESFLEKYQKIILGSFLAVMLILQIVAGYYMQITPQWDFGSVYHAAVQWAEQGDFPDYKEYFYWFNNNLGELGFLTAIFKVAKAVGIKDYNMTATVVNAVLNVCMMLLAFFNCKRITTSVKNGFFILFIFAVSIPSYLGASVFYTDVFSMVYPMLVLYLYLRLREETTWKKRILYGGVMALAAWIGCEIKYTVLIIVIAIVIEVLLRAEWKKALLIVGCSLAVFGICNAIYNAEVYGSHLEKEIAEERNTPLLHWVMMSMQGDGGYNGADYEFTRSFTDLEQRDEALKAKIKERLETMGPSGVYKLALAKAEKCFSDGTYEHNAFFYHGLVRTCFLDDYVLSDGSKYEGYKKFCTGIYFGFWVLMIVGGIISVIRLILDLKQGEDVFQMEYLIPELAVFGLLLFLMMWETNARYIVNYIPMIYVAAVLGMAQVFAFAGKSWRRKK